MGLSATFEPVRVGVIGVGDISTVYLDAIERSPALALVTVAGRGEAGAAQVAAARGVRAASVAELLADDAVELIVDLAPAAMHDDLNARIIQAGKHLYSEKPVALSRARATDLATHAERRGVRIGGAPDTFFGAAHQAARNALDAGAIGAPVLGTAFVGHRGIEWFHPNPPPFYQPGAESPFDIGPYHIVQWVSLLGPVREAYAAAVAGPETRTIRRGPAAGRPFEVEVPTSFAAILTFDRAVVSLVLSLDVLDQDARPSALFGTDGVLFLADPNFFGGAPELSRIDIGRQPLDVGSHPFGAQNQRAHDGRAVANYRGVGLVDMALALRGGGAHRTAPDLLIHVAEVAEAIVASATTRRPIDLVSMCDRPAPLGSNAADSLLYEAMRLPLDAREHAPQP